MDLVDLYRQMLRARAVELATAELWRRGLVSGEMHLGTGEEAVAAGVVAHLVDGDAMALDHRPTPPLVARGIDVVALLRELLGDEEGLCRGRGGHMHLFWPEALCASSGIVGAAAPLAVGFALAGRRLRRHSVAVAFFGEGAMNQGVVLEAFNLAAAWSLPVLFVCKDNQWAITTRSAALTGGDLRRRAEAFGLRAEEVDGREVTEVAELCGRVLDAIRHGGRPAFLLAHCPRLDGHLLGDPLEETARRPLGKRGRTELGRALKGAVRSQGASLATRAGSLIEMTRLLATVRPDRQGNPDDPLGRARQQLTDRSEEVARVEREVTEEIGAAVDRATADGGSAR